VWYNGNMQGDMQGDMQGVCNSACLVRTCNFTAPAKSAGTTVPRVHKITVKKYDPRAPAAYAVLRTKRQGPPNAPQSLGPHSSSLLLLPPGRKTKALAQLNCQHNSHC
jgi:hypothetical protein